MIKNNFRILKKQYAYLQTILKTPVKFQKDWPKTVGGVADTRMVVGADGRTDGRTDRRTLKISEGITQYPATFWWRGIKSRKTLFKGVLDFDLLPRPRGMDPGVRSHGMKADPPGYLWSK